MIDSHVFYSKNFEDEFVFYSLASEFLEAANILNKHISDRLKVDSATIYLTCHAAELFLKAYLLIKLGQEAFNESNYRHNLKKLINDAEHNGMALSLISLREIAKVYQSKKLEYRQNGKLKLTCMDTLLDETKSLSVVTFEQISCQ
jgi:hypothetical protein